MRAWAARFVRIVVATIPTGCVPMLMDTARLKRMFATVTTSNKKLLLGRSSGPLFNCAMRQNMEKM
jgi:hypothetical protein